jgi:hypothetical protein
MENNSDWDRVIVAVPAVDAAELESIGLAFPMPVFRGAVLDAAVTIGTDASTLITLLQAPDAIHALAAWVRDRCASPNDSIEIKAQRGGRRVQLTVDGDIDINVVADFLAAAFQDDGDRP